ncbi:MAG: hypothetical protein ACRDZU_16050, partial [Acidimicrobiales bacterium]
MSITRVWSLLARPIDPWRSAEALMGMTPGAARMLAGVLFITSAEVEGLLDTMPTMIRSLAVGTASKPERTNSAVRGPILWAETIGARSASAGDPGTFVCAIAERAYDTPENRVLASALRTVVETARTVNTQSLRERDSDLSRLVRHNNSRAIRFLDHRALAGVSRGRVTARERARTRANRRKRGYEHALAVLERSDTPLDPQDLELVADARTEAQHAAIVAVVAELRKRGHMVPALEVHGGLVNAGPFTYIHDRSRAAATM